MEKGVTEEYCRRRTRQSYSKFGTGFNVNRASTSQNRKFDTASRSSHLRVARCSTLVRRCVVAHDSCGEVTPLLVWRGDTIEVTSLGVRLGADAVRSRPGRRDLLLFNCLSELYPLLFAQKSTALPIRMRQTVFLSPVVPSRCPFLTVGLVFAHPHDQVRVFSVFVWVYCTRPPK